MQAHAAEWDTLRLFGVGPQIGTRRGDFCDALIPLTLDVTEVTSEWIRISSGAGRIRRTRSSSRV